MPAREDPGAPRIEPVRLHALAPGYAGDLGAHESVEGLAFTSLDLSGEDLSGLVVAECSFEEVTLSEAELRGSSFVTCALDRVDAPVLRAARSRLKDLEVMRSRVGSAELFETTFESVRFTGCKLGYLNLRGAVLTDVVFEDCTIDELDLGGATATRVAVTDTRVAALDVTGARLTEVDLRGAELETITGLGGLAGARLSELQVSMMASMFARHLGIREG